MRKMIIKKSVISKNSSGWLFHTETGWETLGSRRKNHKLTMFYKMKNGLCPDYLVSLVPATVGSVSQYPLHSSSDLQTLHSNSRLY